MEVRYRQSFLRDLKKLKKHPSYPKIFSLVFETLPAAQALNVVPGVKALRGHSHRYRIRVGSYRVGLQLAGGIVELVRVLDRREFYRYFP